MTRMLGLALIAGLLCVGSAAATAPTFALLAPGAAAADPNAAPSAAPNTETTGEPAGPVGHHPGPRGLEEAEAPPLPVSFGIQYCLYSDYVFRGFNLSEYPTEGRDKLNHQLTTNVGLDLAGLMGRESGTYGTISFATFFEWFAGQNELDPAKGGNPLQEIDYGLSYAYELKPLHTTATIGYTFYTYPPHVNLETEEWSLRLDHNDAWMWKWLWPNNDDGILNPYVSYAQDVRQAAGGAWVEFGFSHNFGLFEHFTLTPSLVFAFDRKYIGRTVDVPQLENVGFAYVQYGLNASYDLSGALKLPKQAGTVTLSGFLYYNDVPDHYNYNGSNIHNMLFGGTSVGWSF